VNLELAAFVIFDFGAVLGVLVCRLIGVFKPGRHRQSRPTV